MSGYLRTIGIIKNNKKRSLKTSSCSLNFSGRSFRFDKVFENSNWAEIHEEILPLLPGLLAGSSACVISFGPSKYCLNRSGKSQTVLGELGKTRGLTARSVNSILKLIKPSNLELRASFLQIYDNSISDLSSQWSRVLSLSETTPSFIENAIELPVTSVSEFNTYLYNSLQNRKILFKEDKGVIGHSSLVVLLSLYEVSSSIALKSQLAFYILPKSEILSDKRRTVSSEQKNRLALNLKIISKCVKGQPVQEYIPVLSKSLRRFIDTSNTNLMFLCFVSTSAMKRHNLYALRFTENLSESGLSIEEQIKRDLIALKKEIDQEENPDEDLLDDQEHQFKNIINKILKLGDSGSVFSNPLGFISDCELIASHLDDKRRRIQAEQSNLRLKYKQHIDEDSPRGKTIEMFEANLAGERKKHFKQEKGSRFQQKSDEESPNDSEIDSDPKLAVKNKYGHFSRVSEIDDPLKEYDTYKTPKEPSSGKPPKEYSGDKPPAEYSGDKPPKKYSGDKPPKKYSGDKPPAENSGGKPPAEYSGGKPPKKYSGDKPPAEYSGSKPPKKYPSNMPSKNVAKSNPARPEAEKYSIPNPKFEIEDSEINESLEVSLKKQLRNKDKEIEALKEQILYLEQRYQEREESLKLGSSKERERIQDKLNTQKAKRKLSEKNYEELCNEFNKLSCTSYLSPENTLLLQEENEKLKESSRVLQYEHGVLSKQVKDMLCQLEENSEFIRQQETRIQDAPLLVFKLKQTKKEKKKLQQENIQLLSDYEKLSQKYEEDILRGQNAVAKPIDTQDFDRVEDQIFRIEEEISALRSENYELRERESELIRKVQFLDKEVDRYKAKSKSKNRLF